MNPSTLPPVPLWKPLPADCEQPPAADTISLRPDVDTYVVCALDTNRQHLLEQIRQRHLQDAVLVQDVPSLQDSPKVTRITDVTVAAGDDQGERLPFDDDLLEEVLASDESDLQRPHFLVAVVHMSREHSTWRTHYMVDHVIYASPHWYPRLAALVRDDADPDLETLVRTAIDIGFQPSDDPEADGVDNQHVFFRTEALQILGSWLHGPKGGAEAAARYLFQAYVAPSLGNRYGCHITYDGKTTTVCLDNLPEGN